MKKLQILNSVFLLAILVMVGYDFYIEHYPSEEHIEVSYFFNVKEQEEIDIRDKYPLPDGNEWYHEYPQVKHNKVDFEQVAQDYWQELHKDGVH